MCIMCLLPEKDNFKLVKAVADPGFPVGGAPTS